MKHHIGITIDTILFRRIEEVRGLTKRSTFMQHLLELGFKAYEEQKKNKERFPQ
jgi:metal-responsive CopG/Arc/MetJ family transcriptional regulator